MWNNNEKEFEVGEQFEFHVTKGNVTHNFGLYDPDLNLIAQTQAMPEYMNEVYLTFEEPGTYQVSCLEYCGLGHHQMMIELEVKQIRMGVYIECIKRIAMSN